MNRLFLKIFIWFSAAGLFTFGITLGVWQLTAPGADDPFTTFGLTSGSARFADGEIVEVDRLAGMREPLKWVAEHGFNVAVYLRNGEALLESREDLPAQMSELAHASMDRNTALAQEGPGGSLLFASLIAPDLAIVSQIPPRYPDASVQVLLLRWAVPLICGLLLCLALARYISSPVEKLRHATARLAGGDLEARLGNDLGNRRDEVADAGHAFDRMADQIQALIESERRLLGEDLAGDVRDDPVDDPLRRQRHRGRLAQVGASFAVEPSLVVRTLERALGLGEPRTRREGEGPASGSTSDEEELCGQY